MALNVVRKTLFQNHVFSLLPGAVFCQVRCKTHRQLPRKKKQNPFVSRRTDFIKHLCIALIKHERVFTTISKARQLQEYGDLLINLTQRRRPPPDLFMIKNGFVLTEEEAIETRIRRRIVNRMSKKKLLLPRELPEEQFVEQCKTVISEILLGNEEALEKLHGALASRFHGQYGGFVKVTQIPLPDKKILPNLAYAEFVGNGLKPLPDMPTIVKGRLKAFPRANIIEQDHKGDSAEEIIARISNQ